MSEEKISSKTPLRMNSSSIKKSPAKRSQQLLKKERNCGRIFAAVVTRVLFALHATIALWRVSKVYSEIYIWFLGVGLLGLALETIFAVIIRKGKEYKWFCPSVLFYLTSVVPCLWLLEISRFHEVMNQSIETGICNLSLQSHQESKDFLGQIFDPAKYTVRANNNRSRRHAPYNSNLQNIEFYIPDSANGHEKPMYQGRSSKALKRKKRDDIKPSQHEVPTRASMKFENEMSVTTSPVVHRSHFTAAGRNSKEPGFTINYDTETSNAYTPLATTSVLGISLSETDHGSYSKINTRTITSTRAKTKSTRTFIVDHLSTISVKSVHAIENLVSPTPSVPTTTRYRASTKVTQTHSSEEGMNLGDLGDKINEGISNLKHETEDIWNKTRLLVNELDRTVDTSTWILLLHQVLLFVLVIGRWLLPKGDISRDQLSQLLLVFIGVGADILEFVTETIDGDVRATTSCVIYLHFYIYTVWTCSLLQFTLVLTASKSRKTRIGFDNQVANNTNSAIGCCGNSIFASADLWGILVTMFLQDAPFLATRLYILIVYNLKNQMMIFFTGKNALVVILQVYRIIVLKMKRDRIHEEAADESEMEPLRGPLQRLARRATSSSVHSDIEGNIRDASFKKQNDGSVVVKIRLDGEETPKRKGRTASSSGFFGV